MIGIVRKRIHLLTFCSQMLVIAFCMSALVARSLVIMFPTIDIHFLLSIDDYPSAVGLLWFAFFSLSLCCVHLLKPEDRCSCLLSFVMPILLFVVMCFIQFVTSDYWTLEKSTVFSISACVSICVLMVLTSSVESHDEASWIFYLNYCSSFTVMCISNLFLELILSRNQWWFTCILISVYLSHLTVVIYKSPHMVRFCLGSLVLMTFCGFFLVGIVSIVRIVSNVNTTSLLSLLLQQMTVGMSLSSSISLFLMLLFDEEKQLPTETTLIHNDSLSMDTKCSTSELQVAEVVQEINSICV